MYSSNMDSHITYYYGCDIMQALSWQPARQVGYARHLYLDIYYGENW